MSVRAEFRLPDLGEGLTEAEILRWLVSPGEQVELNQPLVEVETAKAAVEVPSPYAGTVAEVLAQAGDTVEVGTPIVAFTVAGDEPQRARAEAPPPAAETPAAETPAAETPAAAAEAEPAREQRTAVLVGYGPRTGEARRRRRSSPPPEAPERMSGAAVAEAAQVAVLAKPPVRKLAKELGVDLAQIRPTGPGATITRADVEAAAGAPATGPSGGEERLAVKGIRKATAAAMVASAFTAPHVTEFITVDVTESLRLLDRLRADRAFADLPLSPLLLVARALIVALRRHPMVNSSWDEERQEIVVKRYVHLGIAVASPRGLLVPNIKDAHRLDLLGLAQALAELVTTAREGRATPAELTGGTITITNVGIWGIDCGTPIINPGEAAILCLGAVRAAPWVHEGELAIRQLTQLGLSFDHRIIDGALGSQFLADLARLLSDPATYALWS